MKNNKYNIIKRTITALLFAAVCALSMYSCSKNNISDTTDSTDINGSDQTEKQPSSGFETPEIPEISVENNQEEQMQEAVPEKPEFVNPLTGLGCEEEVTLTRPFAVMLDNVKVAAPQNGISHADIVYEMTVEGGLTRLLGVFSDYSGEYTIGAVRSSRDYYIDIAQAHNAIYVHAGGSPEAYSTIYSRKINNLDGVNNGPASSFWRDKERRAAKLSSEHTMVTNPQKVSEGIKIKKYNTEMPEEFSHPLNFLEEDKPIEGSSALKVNIDYSSNCALEYDVQSGLYNKFQYNKPHTDRDTEEQLTFKNILILKASHASTGDDKGRLAVNFKGEGKGYYAVGGIYKEIVWKKDDRISPYTLYESDGETPLLLCAGKSYIAIAPTNIKISFE